MLKLFFDWLRVRTAVVITPLVLIVTLFCALPLLPPYSNAFAQGIDLSQIQQQLQGARQGAGTGAVNPADMPQPDIVQQPAAMPGAVQYPPAMQGTVPYGTMVPGMPPMGNAPMAAVPATPPVLSRLERIMSERAGTNLTQYGYSVFGSARSVTIPQTGAMQDDYVLGPGDEIVVSLRGQENGDIRAYVNRDGQVVLPRLSPISASGRSLGSFRQDLGSAVQRAYVATSASVSVGRIRQISVLVSGEVNNPGQRSITGLSSVVDAIFLSGGIKKSGSLRDIRVIRGSSQHSVDLYSVLTEGGGSRNLRLADGDRIVIPLLGKTVAVTGLVRQPAIYELPARQSQLSVTSLLNLAGGQEVRGAYRLSVLRIQADGRTNLATVNDSDQVRDSEILFVQLSADQAAGFAVLSGDTSLAGKYPIIASTRLSNMLQAPGALGSAPYTLMGLGSRRDPITMLRVLFSFSPVAVIAGKEDMVLQSDDIVRVFSASEASLLTMAVDEFAERQSQNELALRDPNSKAAIGTDISAVLTESRAQTDRNATNNANASQEIQALAQRRFDTPGQRMAEQAQTFSNMQGRNNTIFGSPESEPRQQEAVTKGPTFADIAQQLGVAPLILANYLSDQMVSLSGAVRGPGNYLVGKNVSLKDLVTAAGGTQNWTNEGGVELTSTIVDRATGLSQTARRKISLQGGDFVNYIVRPRDQVRFNPVYTDMNVGSIALQGEVRTPGTFELKRGERLSDVLARAGGLTNLAYPYGTIFLRKSVAAKEREGYLREVRQIQDQMMLAMARPTDDNRGPDPALVQNMIKDLASQTPIGRVSIVADPSVLAARPEMDALLESGDVIYIPQRPATVTVIGQVLSAGSFPYMPEMNVMEYVEKAGGYSGLADRSMTFVVLPDGTARRLEKSWLNFDKETLPPGSVIVVPRDLAPFNLRQIVIDVSQLFSQFAVSVASLAVLSKQ